MPPLSEWVDVLAYVRRPQPGGGSKYVIVKVELPAKMWTEHVEIVCLMCPN